MAHILAVDDDPVLLRVIKAALVKAGHSVGLAKDGHDALAALKKELFDMVITDANMPGGISGFSLVATIRGDENLKHLPIIFLTARRGENDVKKAAQFGVDDYVVKPLDADVFTAKVGALLKAKRMYAFTSIPADAEAVWSIPLTVKGVSEQGMIFHSPVEIPPDTQFRVESKFFAEVSLPPPQLKVVACEPMKDLKNPFTVRVTFVGLSESEHKVIRDWVMNHSHSKKLDRAA